MSFPQHMIDSFMRECTPLRFKDRYDCIHCGSCCTGDGRYLELGADEYCKGLNRYFPPVFLEVLGTYHLAGQFVIREDGTQVCPYLIDHCGYGACDIYDQRPNTCRAFPFTIIQSDVTPKTITGFPYVNKMCQGYSQGRKVIKGEQLRIDIRESTQIFVDGAKDVVLSMELGNMLMEKEWLMPFHNKGKLKNFICKGRIDIPTDEGVYPLIPKQVVWRGLEPLAEAYKLEIVEE